MHGFSTRRAALGCEHLEARDCPAIYVWGGYLTIIGTSGADTVTIDDDGTGKVTAKLGDQSKDATGIKAVTVWTFGGDDSITYNRNGTETGFRAVAIDAGSGNDTVTLNGGDIGGFFSFGAYGGSGTDTLSATVGGVAKDAAAAIGLAGGLDDDKISATAKGEIDGYLAVGLSGGYGNDTITGEIAVADGSTGYVAAYVDGGYGDDTLTLNVTGDGLDELESLKAVMYGGPGTDTGVATDNVIKISIEK